VRVTLPHRIDLADAGVSAPLMDPSEWDKLRTSTNTPYTAYADRAALDQWADEHPQFGDRARDVDKLVRQRGYERLASYGAGSGLAEVWLRRLHPELQLVVTEYAPATVERLSQAMPDADVRHHDLRADPPIAGVDVHFFHRIDTDLDNKAWRATYKRFRSATVIVVAAEVMTPERVREQRKIARQRRHATQAGWFRNAAAFEALWKGTHRGTRMRFGDLDGWLLEPRG
jgi:hypothetical protein